MVLSAQLLVMYTLRLNKYYIIIHLMRLGFLALYCSLILFSIVPQYYWTDLHQIIFQYGWYGYGTVAYRELQNVYIILVTNLMDRPIGKPSIHIIMLKVNCSEIRCEHVGWIHLAQDSSVTIVMNFIFYVREDNYWLSAP